MSTVRVAEWEPHPIEQTREKEASVIIACGGIW